MGNLAGSTRNGATEVRISFELTTPGVDGNPEGQDYTEMRALSASSKYHFAME
jgi:hypothetical protein